MPRNKIFNEEEEQFLKDNTKGKTTKEQTKLFNEKFGRDLNWTQISSWRKRNHMRSGFTGQYEKGNVPHNKGKKMTPEERKKCEHTFFKNGHIPSNRKELGSVRITSDGYLQIKTGTKRPDYSNSNFRFAHKVMYEYYHGEIPKNHKIEFLDQNKMNFAEENLIAVPNDIHGRLTMHEKLTDDAEINKSKYAKAVLMNAVRKRERAMKKKEVNE